MNNKMKKQIFTVVTTTIFSVFVVAMAAGAATTVGDTITTAGLFTGTAGATISGATTSINASSNFATNINTGTSSGALALGGGSGTVAINSSDWDIDATGAMTGIGAITSDGTITAAGFSGPLTGNVTGNVSGTSGSTTGNAATVTNGVYTSNNLSVLAATTSAQLAGVISDETGSGVLVLATSPTLVTPDLGAATATSVAIGGGTVLTKITVGNLADDVSGWIPDGIVTSFTITADAASIAATSYIGVSVGANATLTTCAVSTRTAATSFVVNCSAAPANAATLQYMIMN